ncbi:MAG TPA: NAD-dependent epimerase/dehydratase family protein [Opitutaceae bacterium]|jgi:2'-hydroxyisoflavone reductase|nr:NAD-dependent epimerase/dehydratase family protein [Opitutaceae bacterium]
MKLLVIGGGKFVGRAVVESAIENGHIVTVFNRGKTSGEVPSGVEWIRGDRDRELSLLLGRRWDAVIDTCAYFPRQVETLLRILKGNIGHYLLVSSVSVYADMSEPGLKEDSPLLPGIGGAAEAVTAETYGPFKVMCEQAALENGPSSTLIVRPGIIVGPHDPTGRFSYWVQRISEGGEVLAPGRPDAPLQVIDVRDLGEWMVAMADEKVSGKFNAVGPQVPLTWREMFEAATSVLGNKTRFTWVHDDQLADKKVGDWTQLPLYFPADNLKFRGMFRVDGTAAFARGLKLRPLAETIADNARWLLGPSTGDAKVVGLAREQEKKLLDEWRVRTGERSGT